MQTVVHQSLQNVVISAQPPTPIFGSWSYYTTDVAALPEVLFQRITGIRYRPDAVTWSRTITGTGTSRTVSGFPPALGIQ